MIRNLKALGLMVVAALAMSAMFAAAAQAEGALGTFTAGDTPNTHTPATINGEQYGLASENYFESFGQKVTCTNAGTKFTGTDADGVATTLTITPDYADCNAEGLPATVTMNGCDYTFTRPTTVAPLGTGKYTGGTDLWCPANTRVVIHVYLFGGVTSHFGGSVCTITVGNTAGGHTVLGGHVIYTPGVKNSKDDVTVKATVEGIPAEREGTCATKADDTDLNGKYNSTVTVTAKEDVGAHTNFLDAWISDE